MPMECAEAMKLYKARRPIADILAATGVSKPTLYRILARHGITRTLSETRQGMKLSAEHKANIGKALKGKWCGEDCHWRTRHLKLGHEAITDDLAYIVGVMKGDGYLCKNGIGLEAIDEEFVVAFSEAIKRQFGVNVSLYNCKKRTPFIDWRTGKEHTRKATWMARASSVLVHDVLASLNFHDFLQALDLRQKACLVRGLWDSEGCITICGSASRLQFTHNTRVLCELFDELAAEVAGVAGKVRQQKQGNHIWYVCRKDYIARFYDTIQPTIIRKRLKFESLRKDHK